MRSKVHENRAHVVSLRIRDRLDASGTRIGLVLGTGWGDVLDLKEPREMPFKELPGFDTLGDLEGHHRKVACGMLGGRKVVALRGRVHLNERFCDRSVYAMVRLQVEMLLQLGVDRLILTSAVGSLSDPHDGAFYRHSLDVGQICVVDGFVTVFAPEMPLCAGEFCSPEDTLDRGLMELAVEAGGEAGLTGKTGGHAMVRGPFFEGRRYDKRLLALSGARVVGMSILPEACIAALYPGVKVLALGFVTNDDRAEHSHEANQIVAKKYAAFLGDYLEKIVAAIEI
jgi:purine-nucleoside phosphorylase